MLRSLRSGQQKALASGRDDRKKRNLAAGDGTDYKKGLGACGYFGGKQRVPRFVGEVFGAGEEAQERAALLGIVVADCAAKHGIARL